MNAQQVIDACNCLDCLDYDPATDGPMYKFFREYAEQDCRTCGIADPTPAMIMQITGYYIEKYNDHIAS